MDKRRVFFIFKEQNRRFSHFLFSWLNFAFKLTIEKTLIKELKNKTLLFEQKGKLEILDSEDFDADEVAENLLSVTRHVQPFV